QQQVVPGDAGVADQHLHRALLGGHLLDRRFHGRRVGDIAPHAEQSLGRLARTVGDRHLVAGLGERTRDAQADSPVATGDQNRMRHFTSPAVVTGVCSTGRSSSSSSRAMVSALSVNWMACQPAATAPLTFFSRSSTNTFSAGANPDRAPAMSKISLAGL